MPAWLLPILLKYVLPLIITWLQKSGYLDAAEALLAKGVLGVYQDVKNLKTYSSPTDFPAAPPQVLTPNNLSIFEPRKPTDV